MTVVAILRSLPFELLDLTLHSSQLFLDASLLRLQLLLETFLLTFQFLLQFHDPLPQRRLSLGAFLLQFHDPPKRHFESALYREPGDSLRFSYPADHALAAEFEEQVPHPVKRG